MRTINEDHMKYDSWNIRCNKEFFVILGHFLPFDLCSNPKNQSFEKISKADGDNIILHLCTINKNHMMYGSWAIELKKTPADVIILHNCTKNHDQIYHSWNSRDVTVIIFIFQLGLFSTFLLLNSLKNQNFKKIAKSS